VYGRKRTLRLPFDAATAEKANRWIRFDRRRRALWTPVGIVLMSSALVSLLFVEDDRANWIRLALYAAGLLVQVVRECVERRLTVAQQPELIGTLGVYLPAMSATVAGEWVQRNAAVQVVSERPRWRRYPSLVYRWACGACAVGSAGVWWFALRDGESDMASLLAFVVLLGAAVVLAFKALPVGFVGFDEVSDRRQ
jgi:hypothetical protein